MSADGVNIDSQKVANGLHFWETATTTLTTNWNATVAEIVAKSTASTWGPDDPGTSFAGSYKESGGLTIGEDSAPLIKQVTDLGPNVEKAVTASMTTDAQAGSDLTIPVKGL